MKAMKKDSINSHTHETEPIESLPNVSQAMENHDLDVNESSANNGRKQQEETSKKALESLETNKGFIPSTQESGKDPKKEEKTNLQTGLEGFNSFHENLNQSDHFNHPGHPGHLDHTAHSIHLDQKDFALEKNTIQVEESENFRLESPPKTQQEPEIKIDMKPPLNESDFYETIHPLLSSTFQDSYDVSAGIQKRGSKQPGILRQIFNALFPTIFGWIFAFLTKGPKLLYIALSNFLNTFIVIFKMGTECFYQKKGATRLRKIKKIIKKYSNSITVSQLVDEIAFALTEKIQDKLQASIKRIEISRKTLWMRIKQWFSPSTSPEEETAHNAYHILEQFLIKADPDKLYAENPTRENFKDRCVECVLNGACFKAHAD